MNLYQITIIIIATTALLAALVAFIRTPPSERWSPRQLTKMPGIEYAPMYTKAERIRLVVKNALWIAPLVILLEYWFFPFFGEYSKNANCYNYGPINGVHIVVYGTFVGIPLLSAIIFYFLEGTHAIRAFKHAQYPPPNRKVLQLTAYRYGNSAKRQALLSLLFVACFVCISIWGGFQARALTKEIKPCSVNNLLNSDRLMGTPPTKWAFNSLISDN